MIPIRELPNDRRGFVHKRILGAAKSFVTSGFNPISAATTFLTQSGVSKIPVRRPVSRTLVARPSTFSAQEKETGRMVKFPDFTMGPAPGPRAPFRSRAITRRTGCVFPTRPDPVTGECKVFLGDRPGRDTRPLPIGPGVATGGAVMGRYGAALEPGSRIIDRAVCLRGMQLGDDGLCYNRGSIKNSERMWPRGRRPLLTGGEMRAISIASRAAGRLTRTAVRLQEIGLIKKPVARKPRHKKS